MIAGLLQSYNMKMALHDRTYSVVLNVHKHNLGFKVSRAECKRRKFRLLSRILLNYIVVNQDNTIQFPYSVDYDN